MRFTFEFRLIPCVVAAILILLGLQLARWQTHRAEEKQQAEQAMRQAEQLPPLDWTAENQPPPAAFRQLHLRGEFLPQWVLYLDNRPLQGVAGRYLVMPFRLQGSQQIVLVARGWLPRDPADRLKLPDTPTPAGLIELQGSVRPQFDRVMQLGKEGGLKPGSLLQNLDPAQFRHDSGFRTAGFVLLQTSASADGLQRQWPSPSAGIERHRMYALNWYALSLMAFCYFIFSGIRRGKAATSSI